jgi:hypothetical protein
VYDIKVALRRLRPLIRWTAYRASTNPILRQTYEDLEAEGLLVLVKCCREFPEGQIRFIRYFKRAWYNQLKRFYRDGYALKRQGIEVDLEHAETLVESRDDFLDRMRQRYDELRPFLSQDARRLLELLLSPEPAPMALEYAWREFCRKNKLRSLGAPVTGGKKFRIRVRHIRRALGITAQRMREVVKEVKSANRSHRRK